MPFFAKEKRPLPPTCPTDDIIPVHLFDGSAAARDIIMAWTFKFDDVLDPCAIHDALTQLFQMDGWKKFSGRFRPRPDGRLEIHVPEKSTEARPAVFFSREDHKGSIKDHPLASKLPEATRDIGTFVGPREFTPLALGPETPRCLDDFIYNDKPQFCLHFQTFTDGTLMGFTHSHISTDLGGFVSLLEAWSNVLAGRPEAVTPMIGYRDDPLHGLWNPPPKQTHALADQVLNGPGWQLKYWGLRSLYEAWRMVDIQARTVCIPGRVIEAMVKDARSHLPPGSKFISRGDVLAAVSCLIRARAEGPSSTREVMTIMALDPRGHAKSVFRQDAAYVQNSPANIHVSCPANVAQKLSLGQLALLIREKVGTQMDEDQLKASAALSVETMKTSDLPVIFGSKDMATTFISNWTKGKFSERMDFGPAVVKEAPAPRASPKNKPGHPVNWTVSDPSHNLVTGITSLFVVVGDDDHGNMWMTNTLPMSMWLDFLNFLRQYDEEAAGNSTRQSHGQVRSRL